MIEKAKFTYKGLNRDVSKSKHPIEFYYDAQNIIILPKESQSGFSVSNEKGNKLTLSLPEVIIDVNTNSISYNDQTINYFNSLSNPSEINEQITNGSLPSSSDSHIIIGQTVTRNSIILLSTDNSGFDCIWEIENVLEGEFNLKLLYVRNLNFSTENPIQILFNYENENVQKVYWVDGINQLRSINLKQDENSDIINLIDLRSTSLDSVSDFEIKSPSIRDTIQGGSHTAGRIQYAYNLYNLNASQTKISPLSELVSLNKGPNLGGGDINEVVGTIPIVEVEDIDNDYTHIKLYAIKYTSLNQTPSISIILDSEIDSSRNLTYFDDGSIINEISISEFLFLGSDPYIPNHIESKDNILFISNYKSNNFVIDLDTRAYSFDTTPAALIYDNVRPSESNPEVPVGNLTVVNSTTYSVPIKHDAVNLNYNIWKYQSDGTTIGGEGKYIKYELNQSSLNQNDLLNPTFFKDRDIYRIAIEFYNNLGQVTVPMWIADFKSLDGNLEDLYTALKIEFKPEFYTWLNDDSNFIEESDKPVGYRILRAKRDNKDKTILCQGILNSMVANYAHGGKYTDLTQIQNTANSREAIKLPSLMRSFVDTIDPILSYEDYRDTAYSKSAGSLQGDSSTETPKYASSSDWRAQTWQFNKMMQVFSPDILFSDLNFSSNLQLLTLGLQENTETNNWSSETNVNSGQTNIEAKFFGNHNFRFADYTETIKGDPNSLTDRGFFGAVNIGGHTALHQVYKRYNGFTRGILNNTYDIYGTPELVGLGESFRNYNGDANFRYSNNLTTMLIDAWVNTAAVNNDAEQTILGTQSNGAPNATLVLGPDDASYDILSRPNIDKLYANLSIPNKEDSAIIVELILPDYLKYLGNIYGGNSYEDKRRTTYVKIGEYQDVSNNEYEILNPGDTYVQRFTFEKFSKTGVDLSTNYLQLTEIVSFVVESSIDLKNRNDLSLQEWDSKFQPNYEEYHKYNTVYSQQNILTSVEDVGFKFKEVENFDTRIIASKVKVPGEFIDSWTDFQVNETMDLDGKYGPINSLINYNDNIYALQDTGVSFININPRVQTQASDGISIELGTGNVLYDYNYLTTKSGTINKWSVISTPSGFYYLDGLNKAYYTMQQNSIYSLSDVKYLHTYFNNNINYDIIKNDNHILNQGVSTGYDFENKEVYLTLKQGDDSFTIKYNEKLKEFVSFYSFTPSFYFNKGFRLLTSNPNNNQLWEHGVGEYNKYYDIKYPAYITLLVNPNSDVDCVFNNIKFKSELYINDIDQPDKTITHLTAYNEYQDSGKTELIKGRSSNLRRKFREWNAIIPRDGRNRIRNPWIFLKLELDNPENRKLILHDIIVDYTTY